MSSLADLLSLGMPQGSLATAAPRGLQFNIPQPAPQAQPQQGPSKFRNFLGALGDALMVGGGGQPLYQQQRQQQQQTQALQGFLTNPDQAIQALMGVPGQAANGIDLYKAVHPPSETPLEIKLLQHLKEHPEDANQLHQIDAELHPGMMAPITVPEGAQLQQQSGLPHVSDQASYDAVPPGTPYITPDGHVRQKPGGATASTPSPTFSR